MPDSRHLAGGQDRGRINVRQDYELRDWAQHFGVSAQQLEQAVKTVGDRVDDVEQYLAQHTDGGPRGGH